MGLTLETSLIANILLSKIAVSKLTLKRTVMLYTLCHFFKHFAMLRQETSFILSVAPLCFLYNEPSKLYQVFREIYVRYFFRLHSISSHPSVSVI